MPQLGPTTWIDMAAQIDPILAIPLGSCEQHGPHLALDTDTVIAEALAQALAAQRRQVFVAPAITISASGEHEGFAGTLSIGTDAMAELLIELVRSADWARGVVLVNGHGGNADAIAEALVMLSLEQRNVWAWWPAAPNDPRADSHAGWLETSVMLHLDPSRVRMDRLEPGDTRPLHTMMDELTTHGVRAVSPNGVLGNPTTARADDGRAVMQTWISNLVDRFDEWLERVNER